MSLTCLHDSLVDASCSTTNGSCWLEEIGERRLSEELGGISAGICKVTGISDRITGSIEILAFAGTGRYMDPLNDGLTSLWYTCDQQN